MSPSRVVLACAIASLLVPALGGCEREARKFSEPASKAAPADAVRASPIQPGGGKAPLVPAENQAENNAYAVSQGQRLYVAFNCIGCHSRGGGGSGPALMDDKWIYGAEPANVFQSIVQGRPNGMPSFGGKIPETQVWQIVAYVRSMSGQLGSATAPGRTDSISAGEPEAARDRERPVQTGTPQPR
jgi:cytochrome c oxidase cbb3-type subunit III